MEYLVTDIKDITAKKKLVYINYEPAFAIYAGEVFKLKIKTDTYIPENVYDEIIELLTKRSLTRALHLFKDRDYTEHEIRAKLTKGYYPEKCIETTVEYLKENKFIDDVRYAGSYISFRAESNSRRVIEGKLRQKGISALDIEAAYSQYSDDNAVDDAASEYTALVNILGKKLKGRSVSEFTYEERQKLIGYMGRKGFSYDLILKAFNEFLDNEQE
jgi:regulatory protein